MEGESRGGAVEHKGEVGRAGFFTWFRDLKKKSLASASMGWKGDATVPLHPLWICLWQYLDACLRGLVNVFLPVLCEASRQEAGPLFFHIASVDCKQPYLPAFAVVPAAPLLCAVADLKPPCRLTDCRARLQGWQMTRAAFSEPFYRLKGFEKGVCYISLSLSW